MLANSLLSTRHPVDHSWFPKADKSLIVRDSPYNGVTNVSIHSSSNKQRDLESFARIQKKNEPFDNYNAVQGVVYTPMMIAYFSKENMAIVQNAIVAKVHQLTGKRIPYVDRYKLSECMVAQWEAYLPYDPSRAREDIIRLNEAVVARFVKNAKADVEFYIQGRERISTLPVNLFRPVLTKKT